MWIANAIRSGDYLQLLLGLAVRALIIFTIMPIHEFAHGWAASKLGDPTAKGYGRLTFRPMAHVDPIGAIFIVLFGFGWAKPVPVNPFYFKHRKRDMALVALAGPLSNLIVAIGAALIFNVLYLVLPNGGFWMPLVYFFYYFITINISLAVFNLLPVPPLDGSKIFGAVLPDRWTYTIARYERYIFLILAGALFSGVLDGVLGTLNGWAYDAIFAIADLPFRLFGLF